MILYVIYSIGDKLELTYLFQRLSIAIQRGNELCFNGTFVPR